MDPAQGGHTGPRISGLVGALVLALIWGGSTPASGVVRPISSPQGRLLQRVRTVAEAGDYDRLLELTADLPELPDGERGELLLYRALARYRRDETQEAAADLHNALITSSSVRQMLRRSDGEDRTAWPDDFLEWVATVPDPMVRRLPTPLPEVSLADLNLGREVRAVSSHFVVDVEVVRIPVIVEDEGGGFVSGLGAESFSVSEGDAAARPVRELISEREPTSVGILIDASRSALDKTAQIKDAVARMMQALRPEDEIFLVQFGQRASFLSAFNTDREVLRAALEGFSVTEGRALLDAVALGLIQMRDAVHDKKALIVLADGDDVGSQTAEADLRLAARREGVSIHALVLRRGAVRWRPFRDEGDETATPQQTPDGTNSARTLQELVHNTGGLVALRPGVDQRYGGLDGWLERATDDVSGYINNQYLIFYSSPSPPPRGRWRTLAVQVAVPHDRVRARSGYVR